MLFRSLSSLTAILGAGIALFLGDFSEQITPILIAIAAGSFLYIAGSDLVPELHKTSNLKKSVIQFIAIIIGVSLMFALTLFG